MATKGGARTCGHCGRPIEHDTEEPWGLCTRCLTNPKVPLTKLTLVGDTGGGGPDQQADRAAGRNGERPYRARPLRRCPGCGVALRPRVRYCDRCRDQKRRERTRARVQRFRQLRAKTRRL